MNTRISALLAGLFIFMAPAHAQKQIEASGVVLSEGEPLMGAAVQVIGAETLGKVTDMDGRFSMAVPEGSTLRISFIGMKTMEMPARKNMRIVLEDELKAMDEVIVVAYGTAKKSAFTGSAAVIKAEDINRLQINNPLDALSGKVSGVQLNNASGQPGESAAQSILIRGISSINAGTAPLYIVDGAPFSGDMNTISNQDIESISVLKDAASAALYGARGANGVVLITTKNAKRIGEKNGTVTFDAKWGANSRAIPTYNTINSPAKYYEMWYEGLNRYARNEMGRDADQATMFANQNLTANNSYGLGYNVYNIPSGEYLIGRNGHLNPNATLGRTYTYGNKSYMLMPDDWDDAIYSTGLRQEYTLTATGANEKGAFYASLNYLSNEGITISSNSKRLTGRLKADYQIKPWLKFTGNISYAHYTGNFQGSDGSTADSGNMFSYTQLAPIYPLYIRDGQGNILYNNKASITSYDYGNGTENGMVRPVFANANPLSDSQLNINRKDGNAVSATGSVEIRLPYDIKVTSTNTIINDEARFNSSRNPYFGQYANQNGIVSVEHYREYSYNLQQFINWTHDFGPHNVELMLGHEYYRAYTFGISARNYNQFSTDSSELSGAITTETANSSKGDYNVEGYFARALYNYNNKYFFSVSYRRDGSSRFHPDNRWGNFYSFGGAWLISKERWFRAKCVDELKFKASFGQQGNDNIGNYLYTNIYNLGSANGSISITPSTTMGNKDITWETGTNFNTGFEFSLWRGRLSGSIEYFYRLTSDMLYQFPITPSFGYTNKWVNVGDMANNGIEIDLQGDVIRTRDITLSLRANLTAYKNKITNLPQERRMMTVDGVEGYSSTMYFYGQGETISTFYLPRYAGVKPDTGEALYYKDVTDANGKVTGQTTTTQLSEATYHLCGNALPDAYGGFGTTLAWKGLDISLDFNYQIGGQVYDNTYANQMSFSRGMAFNADLLNAWTETNRNTNVPRLQYNDPYTAGTSDRFLTDASYLTLQNINVGYSLPMSITSKLGLQKVRVYMSADNVWIWSKRQGMDPRQSVGSTSAEYYAPIRSISGGITITL